LFELIQELGGIYLQGMRRRIMSIQEEILSEFFKTLEKAVGFPEATILRLKELWQQGNLASKEEIRAAIAKGIEDATKS
jgi:hypothetical protein